MCKYTSEVPLSTFQTTPKQNQWHSQQKTWGWTQYLWTLQPWLLLTLCLNITPVTTGCASATSTQVIRKKRISISSSISLSQDSISNSHFPGTKSLIFTSQLLPSLLKNYIEPTSAERGLHDYIQVDQPIFIKWLHSGSTKSRPTGHRRGRPPRTSCELSWHKVLLSFHRRRRRGRPPRSVLLLPWLHRPKGPRRGRPPNNYHSLETDPASVFFFIGCPDISCFLYVLLLPNKDAHWQPELHSNSFQGGGGVIKAQLIILQFLCRPFKFVYSSLSSYEKRMIND